MSPTQAQRTCGKSRALTNRHKKCIQWLDGQPPLTRLNVIPSVLVRGSNQALYTTSLPSALFLLKLFCLLGFHPSPDCKIRSEDHSHLRNNTFTQTNKLRNIATDVQQNDFTFHREMYRHQLLEFILKCVDAAKAGLDNFFPPALSVDGISERESSLSLATLILGSFFQVN